MGHLFQSRASSPHGSPIESLEAPVRHSGSCCDAVQDCDFAGASSGSWAAMVALLATQGAGRVDVLFQSGRPPLGTGTSANLKRLGRFMFGIFWGDNRGDVWR